MKCNEMFKGYGLRIPDSNRDFGIEIEVEGHNIAPINTKFWTCTRDGSLRGESMEYISNGPQLFKDFKKIHAELMQHFKDHETIPKMSFRTSVHVHLNVNHLTPDELRTVVYLYLLFEEDLLKFSGEERYGNRFCLSIRDAEGFIESIKYHLGGTMTRIVQIKADYIRYSSLNIASLIKFGTLEFRSMRGTLDYDVLSNWLKLIQCLRDAAVHFKNAKKVYDFLMNKGSDELYNKVFGNLKDLIKTRESDNDVLYNSSLLIELPFIFKEFEKEEAAPEFNPKIQLGQFGHVDIERLAAEIAVRPLIMPDNPQLQGEDNIEARLEAILDDDEMDIAEEHDEEHE